MKTTLDSWSFSTMINFQSCKYQVKLDKLDKLTRPPLVIPKGKEEHPMSRGLRVHNAAERYVQGDPIELIPELHKFSDELIKLRQLYGRDDIQVEVEGDWAFTKDWIPTGWMSKDTWLRMKCDVAIFNQDNEALIIDYKTGKIWGNEVKFMMQAQLYQLGTFMRYPELNTVYAEWWMLDLGEIKKYVFTRPKGLMQLAPYEHRGLCITTEERFPPNPNNISCKYCPWRSEENGGTGDCKHAMV